MRFLVPKLLEPSWHPTAGGSVHTVSIEVPDERLACVGVIALNHDAVP
jgi:hypothetical protein